MSDNAETLGRGHRVSVKTPAMVEYTTERNKSKQTVENNVRTKHVQQQEAQLVAEEQAQTKTSKATKGKSKVKPSKSTVEPVGTPLDIDPEEARNVAETRKYERRCVELQYMIHGRTGKSLEKLKLMDGDELEVEWQKALAGNATTVEFANPPSKPKGKMSTNKAQRTPVAMETPAKKIRASKPVASKISLIGSPLVPLTQAREQSARAEVSSPAVLKCTRDVSTERTEEDARRRRVVLNNQTASIAPTKPLKTRKVVVQPAASAASSRASSTTPSTTSVHSKSGASGRAHTQSMDLDVEVIDFEDMGASGGEEDEMDDEDVESELDPASRPKKSDYKGTIEGLVIDRAVDHIETALIENPCPTADEYELMIHQGWEVGVNFYNKSSKVVKLTDRINRVIKSLISSFRTRARRRMVEVLASHFGLDLSPTQSKEDVKSVAASLLPIRFHQDPNAKSDKAGHYRSDFVARSIATLFYFGPKPPALRADAVMEPMPEVTVAYSCAVAEEILMRYKKDGYVKVEQKAPKGQGQARSRKKDAIADKEIVPRTGQDELKELMDVHLKNLEPFREAVPRLYAGWLFGLHDECLQWAGKPTNNSCELKPAEGTLTADSFADEEDISPEELNAVLTRSRARTSSVESNQKRQISSRPRPQPRACPQPLLRADKSPNLEGIVEEPNSNSESDSESDSGLGGESKAPDTNEKAHGQVYGQKDSDDIDMSDYMDRKGDNMGVGGDIEMSDEDDAEPPVRKPAVKSARHKLVASDDEEEEEGGEGDDIGEGGVEKALEYGAESLLRTNESGEDAGEDGPNERIGGSGILERGKTPPSVPEPTEYSAKHELITFPTSPPSLAAGPNQSAQGSRFSSGECSSAGKKDKMIAALEKRKQQAEAKKQSAQVKKANKVAEQVLAEELGPVTRNSKAAKDAKPRKTGAKKGK